jgi:hypothetical protein
MVGAAGDYAKEHPKITETGYRPAKPTGACQEGRNVGVGDQSPRIRRLSGAYHRDGASYRHGIESPLGTACGAGQKEVCQKKIGLSRHCRPALIELRVRLVSAMADSKMFQPLTTTCIAGLLSLAGVWLGNYLSQQNSFVLLQRQRQIEMQTTSYSKLMGLKIAWTQAIKMVVEAKVLRAYYDAEFRITGRRDNRDDAKRQNDREIELISRASDITRELLQSLGDVQIAFERTKELDAAVDAISQFKVLDVHEPPPKIKTVADLDNWQAETYPELSLILKTAYENKMDALLSELLRQLRQAKPASN